MNEAVEKFIKAHAEESRPHECGGIIVKNSFGLIAERCKNISPTPEKHCLLSRDEIISKSKGSELVYFYHSHPDGETDDFSWEDKYVSEKLKLKLILYCSKNESFKIYKPRGWIAPLVGRDYRLGVFEDSELVEDYYRKYLNTRFAKIAISTSETAKTVSSLEEMINLIIKSGFKFVKDLKKHDLLALGEENEEHLGIYLGNGIVLHHPHGEKSRMQNIDSLSLVRKILRPPV